MKLLKLLLFPVALLYGIGVIFRNMLYNTGVFKEHSFPIPIISVGNLSTGGTGKSPHIEYLIRLLKKDHEVATLSRGYGRMSNGFSIAETDTPVYEVGDEPKQFKTKYPTITVAVDESRVNGIKKLLNNDQKPEVILLDDAFQHRAVKPSINILLTDYSSLYINDTLIPTGNLREWKNGAKRADFIVVTKTPSVFSPIERRLISDDLKPMPQQKVLFSYLEYGNFIPLQSKEQTHIPKEFYFERSYSILLVTGIANPATLLYYLKKGAKEVRHISFPDHHRFSINDLQKIRSEYTNFALDKTIIVTTEKDAQRLLIDGLEKELEDLPIFYLPIEVVFHKKDKEIFDNTIQDYVANYSANS